MSLLSNRPRKIGAYSRIGRGRLEIILGRQTNVEEFHKEVLLDNQLQQYSLT